ncbi:thiol-activated cytolysin family protein [Gilvibacter sediminis]|uniref:thiol-activated cytolysin family protein n=1 Tax=Gilvibacter sediminis TaxID=379071 RepID=UPI002350D212|nr:thiol-activated cytolysin family protein [Gilvibacter sediminis]MDC7996613.1 thiol-activated cytolysin family protein [Gilvibacter sediminis]
MKTTLTTKRILPLLLGGFFILFACSTEDDGLEGVTPDANSINEYLLQLSYNQDELLEVQETGGLASSREVSFEDEDPGEPVQGTITGCTTTGYNLYSNFDQIAILRPSIGVIYPGALVVGNGSMLDGEPTPFAVDRAPANMRVDLPGIGENGNFRVESPGSFSAVDAELDVALEWWNDNAYQDGYVNEANSTYQSATSYSSTQLSFDIGLNAEWASGSIAAQFDYESNTERRVASIAFKQVFYTVTMDTPISPAAVFGTDVSLEQVQAIMNSDTPPAYVASVAYGRIIMVRMETTNMDTSINLNAVLEYGSGFNNATGTLAASYDEVLQNSSMSIITIGGNAEVATSAVDAANIEDGPGSLNYIITGENAVYSRTNPGAPIAYTIRYLKDNTLAKMGYTTDYVIEECGSRGFDHEEVTVTNDSFHDIRFRLRWRGQNTTTIYNGPWVFVNQDDTANRTPPNGAHDVEVQTQWQCGTGGWNTLGDFELDYVYDEECFRASGGSFPCGDPSVSGVTCN